MGSLVRVLFDDGVKYLGKISKKDERRARFVIVFEDEEEHSLPLPHADVEPADAGREMEEWEAQAGWEEGAVPWWCDTPTAHSLEAGEFNVPVPQAWRRLVIKPPERPAGSDRADPKGPRKKRGARCGKARAAEAAAEAGQADVLGAEAGDAATGCGDDEGLGRPRGPKPRGKRQSADKGPGLTSPDMMHAADR